jgi:superfamily II DNA/RNA helicase
LAGGDMSKLTFYWYSMAAEYLTNPVMVQIGVHNELNANKNIKQEVMILKNEGKAEYQFYLSFNG